MKSQSSTTRSRRIAVITLATLLSCHHTRVNAFVSSSASASTSSSSSSHSVSQSTSCLGRPTVGPTLQPARQSCHPPFVATSQIPTRLYNQPLATEGEWSAYADLDKTGFVYYFNAVTGESLWEKPTSTFPDVVLTGNLQLQAQRKQEEYLNQIERGGSVSASSKKKGFFQAILETPAEPVKPRETSSQTAVVEEKTGGGWFGVGGTKEKKKEEDNWFASLTSSSTKESTTTTTKKEEDNWFGSLLAEGTTATTKKEEDNWFGSLFAEGTAATSEPTKEKPIAVEGRAQKAEVETGGLFGGIFQSSKDTATIERMKEVTTTTEQPVVVEAPIQIQSAAYVLPHPAKIRWGGEDAVFTKGRTFGVFDGVSGAEKLDGVPLYSKTLADEMKRLVTSDDESLTIQELTKRLTQCSETADRTATGASTAIVACIGADGFLRALNVGDSACIVIRNNRVVARTREITHYFECPYQLSVDSPDRPRDGTKLNVELQRGDLVLMASDGIFDNLNDEQICEIVGNEKTPTIMAKRVSELSRKVSLDTAAPTPYAKLAKRFGDPDYADGLGGKVDDVSCIVVSYN